VSINATFIPSKASPIEESSDKYAMLREVTHDYTVGPGIYCIIPTTQFPGEEADFLLRVLTPQQSELKLVLGIHDDKSWSFISSLDH
jgi:Calpain large subunit, domain III